MDSGFKFVHAILFFHLLCGGSYCSGNRKVLEMYTQNNPEVNIFFTPDDLKTGKRIEIYFAFRDALTPSPRLLSREDAVSIPFSSADLPRLLDRFSFTRSSPQTLRHCEFPAMDRETKLCATSLESMLDSVREILGAGSHIRAMATEFATNHSTALRNYSVVGVPREIVARGMVGCHRLPYPYAVFYCHNQEGDARVFEMELVSEDGVERVEAMAICHMDTSQWNRAHVLFRVLGIESGSSPVCHFFPPDNLVWVSSDSHDS